MDFGYIYSQHLFSVIGHFGWIFHQVHPYVGLPSLGKRWRCLKGLVHPKMKILSLITHPHVVPNPFFSKHARLRQYRDACVCIALLANKAKRIQVLRQNLRHTCVVVLSWTCIKDREEKKLLNNVIIFVVYAHKKYSQSFIKLRLNHWCHMDYFNNVFTNFLGLESVNCVAVYAGSESSGISSKIS